MTNSVGASLPGAAPRNPRETEQLARLKARDLDGFVAVLLESVRLYADTEAGRSGMGSPVLAGMVYAGIERDIAMLAGAALEAGPPDARPRGYLGGCNCYCRAPMVPTYRSIMTHLDNCPAKGSGYAVGVIGFTGAAGPAKEDKC